MNIRKIGASALLTFCLVSLSFAQDRVATGKSAETYDLVPGPAIARTVAAATSATANSEVFQSIVVAAGKTATINSALDYTSANTVAVTVQCIVCSTAATSLTNSGLVLLASWLVPNAASYVAPESKAATAFLFWDAGGALFNVYGSQFRLILQNTGTGTIAIQQVTIFQRGQ